MTERAHDPGELAVELVASAREVLADLVAEGVDTFESLPAAPLTPRDSTGGPRVFSFLCLKSRVLSL